MNVQRLRKFCVLGSQQLRFIHQSKSEVDLDVLPKQDAKVSQIESGIKIASLENYSPVTEIAVIVKAGSRYENRKENLGISHRLRNAATLSTKNHTAFALTRNVEVRGSKLWATGTRDHLIFNLQCSRDEVDSGLELLSEITCKQVFKPWELEDSLHSMHYDVQMHKNNPVSALNELLHKAAFRGGLSNSLYSPLWMIGKHDSEMLHHYVHEHFTASRTSVIALGVNHDHFEKSVKNLFHFHDNQSSNTGTSKFVSGEVRKEMQTEHVHAAIVGEGSGIQNSKEMLSLSILELILGSGSQRKFTKLSEAASKQTQEPFCVNSININYSDTGLFGLYISGNPGDMNNIIKAAVSEMKKVAKSINENSVEIAKHQLKAKLMFERDNSSCALAAMIPEISEYGQVRDGNDILKAVDALKLTDIQTVASKVVKMKPAMAAVGRLYNTPHVDELV